MCCAIAGERFRGDDHRRAAEYLGQITGDTACAGALRDLIERVVAERPGLSSIQRRLVRSGRS